MPIASGTPAPPTLPSSTPWPLAPARWRAVFPGDQAQLRPLRRWLESLLPACPARDEAQLIAVELAANAIAHTASGDGGWFIVEVTWCSGVVRIAIADGGSADVPHLVSDATAEHGRGLHLVRELSERTGMAGDARGRLVWAEVRWPAMPGQATAACCAWERAIVADQHDLQRRFPGIRAWFGRTTLQWWALLHNGGPGGQPVLMSAPSAQVLADYLAGCQPPR
ncbi:ATP-binding protein [Spongiactinospora sp. TRM90649]|uniref:ATP-binding protein n=1 Tax=Spongiactinospora sp. TRM90649 TaxID=3031114 RepID=UPI0023F7EEB9|nr:ATP-binding protein [Spongiactinospora sp. TRM90649]MDF5758389.1 ATP-binding protein [Spongiactinospora sp. TRM90649]